MEAPLSAGDHFIVEDLFDFSNEDNVITGGTLDSSVATDSYNSPSFSVCETNFRTDTGCQSFIDDQFAGEFSVPYDDLAELEWMSNFVEESFSCEDMQKLQLISGLKTRPETTEAVVSNQIDEDDDNNNPIFNPDMVVPAKARSKRSRAAAGNWASRLLVLSPTLPCTKTDIVVPVQPVKTKKKNGGEGGSGVAANPDGRRCLHCATDKTPQWRTGPMGPKTLCNACGVRYKSGRLVPEYRPAASPTFMLTKHSNSHRKVLELRRQKEMVRGQQEHHHHQPFIRHHNHHQNMVFDASDGDDYLIHHYVGPDFRQLI